MECSGSRKVAPTLGSPRPELQTIHPALAAAGFHDLLLFFCGRRQLMRVEGWSMWPTLSPGDRVLLKPLAGRAALPERGSIVVSRHPFRPSQRLIKRLVDVDGEGSMLLLGDHPAQSTDSRQLGPMARSLLIGAVTKVIRQPRGNGSSEHSSSEHSG